MTTAFLVMRRFNVDELTVRRLFKSNPVFQSLCEDYATACCALERWRSDERKAGDYVAVIEELEQGISDFLQRSLNSREYVLLPTQYVPKGSH